MVDVLGSLPVLNLEVRVEPEAYAQVVLTATVSRYLKWARELRKNIIKGSKHFPKYK